MEAGGGGGGLFLFHGFTVNNWTSRYKHANGEDGGIKEWEIDSKKTEHKKERRIGQRESESSKSDLTWSFLNTCECMDTGCHWEGIQLVMLAGKRPTRRHWAVISVRSKSVLHTFTYQSAHNPQHKIYNFSERQSQISKETTWRWLQ